MALNKITYDNKESLNPQPTIANINKVSDTDMNEIKNVVNNAIDQVNINTTKLSLWGCEELGNKTSSFNANDCNVGQSFYWSVGNQPLNTPINAGRIYCFQGYGSSSTGKFQLCFSYLTNSNKIYVRTYFNGTWGAWYYITLTQA